MTFYKINRPPFHLLISVLCIFIIATCTKIEHVPKVTTGAVSEITNYSAKVIGNIIDTGDGIIQHGHCWSTSPNTTYYVRAYATNSAGTGYGSQLSVTTPGAVTYVDGNVYNIVIIGTHVWMKENLKTTKYNDGSNIPLVIDSTTWVNLTTPGYCWYNNDATSHKNTYGALYNWYAVNTGKLCPAGWYVPSDTEWQTLMNYLGG